MQGYRWAGIRKGRATTVSNSLPLQCTALGNATLNLQKKLYVTSGMASWPPDGYKNSAAVPNY